MANFDKAFEKTSLVEGGYANNPNDKGGETYRGISRKNFPNWDGWADIDLYKKQNGFPNNIEKIKLDVKVKKFFKTQFWDAIRLDEINNQEIAEELYDSSVNFGETRAVKFAQEACNLLNNRGKIYSDIDVDGIIGPKTISKINNHPDAKLLYNLMNILQGERYVEICRVNPSQEVFLKGWLKQRVIFKE